MLQRKNREIKVFSDWFGCVLALPSLSRLLVSQEVNIGGGMRKVISNIDKSLGPEIFSML